MKLAACSHSILRHHVTILQLVVVASEHGCETLVCNLGAPLSMSPLPSAEGHVVCCWPDGLVAAYKRSQLFALSVWTLQLPHRIACMCVRSRPDVILAASAGGSCSMISAVDGRIISTFSLGPVVVMAIFLIGDASLLCVTRDGRIMMFSTNGSIVCKEQLSLGCPLIDVTIASDCVLSVVKSNGCVQLVEFFPDDFAFWDKGSVVCLKTASMSVLAGAYDVLPAALLP